MATPTFNLPTSGSDPKRATKEGLEENINSIIQYLDNARISGDAALMTGLEFQGGWDASTGLFPDQDKDGNPITKGDFFWVAVEGTFGGETYSVNEPLVATVDNPSTSDVSDWYHAPLDPSLVPILSRIDDMAVPFDTVADFFAATIADIKTAANATAGTAYVYIKDGQHTAKVDLGQSSSDANWVTVSGVEVEILPSVLGLNVKAFGAKGDGVSDDVESIQGAINAAINYGGRSVYFPAAHYYCGADLYGCYDASFNNSVTSDPLQGGRIGLIGEGPVMSRRDFESDRYPGSVIRFAAGKRLVLSVNGGPRGWKKVVQNISVIGDNGTIIEDGYGATGSRYSGLFVGTINGVADEAVFYVSDNYSSTYEDIEIIGDKTLTFPATHAGIGFHADPSDTAGGANTYRNITAAYFDTPLLFGLAQFDAAQEVIGRISTGNTVDTCQGHYCRRGIFFSQNFGFSTVTATWSERCLDVGMQVSNSARNIIFESCAIGIEPGTPDSPIGSLQIGDDTGVAGQDRARNITVRNSGFLCFGGFSGILVHEAAEDVTIEENYFNNNGGAAVGFVGDRGGEVIFRNNRYTSTDGVTTIPAARRFCKITGSGGSYSYENVMHIARSTDTELPELGADLDCSDWRFPPEFVTFTTFGATRTLTLPVYTGTTDLQVKVKVIKPQGQNTIVIDAGAGSNIKGSQTLTLTAAYSSIDLIKQQGARWDVLQQT